MQPLLSSLLAIFFGSVASAIVAHVLASHRTDREYRLRKLEELMLLESELLRWVANYFHFQEQIVEGILTFENMQAMKPAHMKASDDYYTIEDKMNMVIDIYFSNDLMDSFENLRQASRKVLNLAFSGIHSRENEIHLKTQTQVIHNALNNYHSFRKDFRFHVSRTASFIRDNRIFHG